MLGWGQHPTSWRAALAALAASSQQRCKPRGGALPAAAARRRRHFCPPRAETCIHYSALVNYFVFTMACSRAVGRPGAAGWAPARAAAPQRRLARPRAIVGVDLGTSNSCVAFIKDGEAQVLPLGPDGDASVPSVVAFTKVRARAAGAAN